MKKTRILLADDHRIFRDGLRLLLSQEEDFLVAGEAEDGRAAVRLAVELNPHVVVMDVGMPGLNGIEATRQILRVDSSIRVIGLSVHDDRRFVTGMLMAGAKGYLLKNCAGDDLVHAIRRVMDGRIHVGAQVTDIVVDAYVQNVQESAAPSVLNLTEREREVARLLAGGQNNKQIAATLEISVKTIETHRQHLMDKLGFHSIADLTRFAIREGLVSPED